MNNDLISRSELKKAIKDNGYSHYFEIFDIIDNAPTVEPIKQCKYCKHCGNEDYCSNCHSDHSLFEYYERPQGEWIFERPNGKTYSDFVYCSECQKPKGFYLTNYCPYCGADMRKGGAEE